MTKRTPDDGQTILVRVIDEWVTEQLADDLVVSHGWDFWRTSERLAERLWERGYRRVEV